MALRALSGLAIDCYAFVVEVVVGYALVCCFSMDKVLGFDA